MRDADPGAKVTTMLDTDISHEAYKALGITEGYHTDMAKKWSK